MMPVFSWCYVQTIHGNKLKYHTKRKKNITTFTIHCKRGFEHAERERITFRYTCRSVQLRVCTLIFSYDNSTYVLCGHLERSESNETNYRDCTYITKKHTHDTCVKLISQYLKKKLNFYMSFNCTCHYFYIFVIFYLRTLHKIIIQKM